MCFRWTARAAPFSDNNVRMALKYGIERQELLDKILSGYGALGNDHPISSSNRFFNTDLPQREYDADKAKYYLKQAGMDLARRHPVGGGRGLRRRRRRGGALLGIGRGGRHQHHRRPGAQRWLLGQRLDEEAVLRQLLGRPADRGLDVHHRLRQGRAVERELLGQRPVQRASGRRPLGTGRGQAPGRCTTRCRRSSRTRARR